MRKVLIAEILCTLAVVVRLEAVVIHHQRDPEDYRDLAAVEPFRSIVEIEVQGGFGVRRGSGVVIGDRWVVTAAHVTSGAGHQSVRVRSSGAFTDVEGLHYAEGWSSAPVPGLSQGADLVLLRLGGATNVTASEIAPTVGAMQVGFLGGFGKTGNGILGASGSPEMLFGMNVIDRVTSVSGGRLLVTDFDDGTINRNALDSASVRRTYYDVGFDDPKLTTTVLDIGDGTSDAGWDALPTAADYFPGLGDSFLEATSSPGDSGGPLFVYHVAMDQWQLAGLSSWGVNPLLPEGFARGDSRYGDLAFFTDLSAHRSWILETIPEPRTSFIVGSAFLLMWLRRRK